MPKKSITEAEEYINNYEKNVAEAARRVLNLCDRVVPNFGIILGSELGDLENLIEKPRTLLFEEVPFFEKPSSPGHEGKIIAGKIEGVSVVALKGRVHYYEVAPEYSNSGILQTVFPVNVLADMNIKNIFVTNAARALNLKYNIGDIMILKSHISEYIPSPNQGKKYDFKRVDGKEDILGFERCYSTYDSSLRLLLRKASGPNAKHVHEGVYIAIPGADYETESEAMIHRQKSADAIGMSTVNEIIAAKNRGMNSIAISFITNKILMDGTWEMSYSDAKGIFSSKNVKDRLFLTIDNFFRLYKEKVM